MARLVRLLVAAALTAAIALVVVQALQARSLRRRYGELYVRATQPHAGIFLPTFQASSLDGRIATIGESPDGGRQVLFIFTHTCPYCRASLPAWRQIADSLAESGVGVYGISLDSAHQTRAYVAENGLSFPVVHFPLRKLAVLYRTRTVPQTMVVDGEGRVVFARTGVVSDGPTVDSVLHFALRAAGSPTQTSVRAKVASNH